MLKLTVKLIFRVRYTRSAHCIIYNVYDVVNTQFTVYGPMTVSILT